MEAQASNNGGDEKAIEDISSLNTLRIIESKRKPKRVSPRSQCTFYDRTFRGYEWLLPGWVAETRVMDHGRLYRYFYDPEGRQYKTKSQVLCAWEESGLVLLN